MPFRFLLVAPLTLVALACFASYFVPLNATKSMAVRVPLALTAGLATAITNPLFNIFVATFIFWEWPPLRNEDGKLSPFFTTRIKKHLSEGRNDPPTLWFVWAVNTYDPDHF
jgi:hypothetical protein